MCPSDDRQPNTNFFYESSVSSTLTASGVQAETTYGNFDNTNVSYWVGTGANDTFPQGLLGGDRNMGAQGGSSATPGTSQDPNYGFSAPVGTTTGDYVIASTNGTVTTASQATYSSPSTGSMGWSAKLHSAGNTSGAGNIMLGDGSAQQVTSGNFRLNWLKNAVDAGNFVGTQQAGSVALVFP
jgi:hypothetical protein